MKRFALISLLLCFFVNFSHTAVCKEAEIQTDPLYETLLSSNLDETPYTAMVQILSVEEKGNRMLLPTYNYHCKVIETYKGKAMKFLDYYIGMEEPPSGDDIGKTVIVSLFINPDNGIYYVADNGYVLPASAPLIEIAKKFKARD